MELGDGRYVPREGENLEAAVAVLVVQRLQALILAREAALAGGVDNLDVGDDDDDDDDAMDGGMEHKEGDR